MKNTNTESNLIKCGWCITGHHDSCRPILVFNEKTWACGCHCHSQSLTEDTAQDNHNKNE